MIRLYGQSLGQGSFTRVSRGMRSALTELGLLDGFVPVDAYNEEAVYPGAMADVGVFVGPPSAVGMMSSIGWHKKRFALLLANSSWMPQKLVDDMGKLLTGFIASSEWAASVLRGYTDLPVKVWPLGVDPAFAPRPEDHQRLQQFYTKGSFRVLHMSSTNLERKGTKILIDAWIQAVQQGLLGPNPELYPILEGPPGCGGGLFHIYKNARQDFSPLRAAEEYRRYHLVAQPSRGEGFGMVPLEARACGVPVLMTGCTGHSEHVYTTNRLGTKIVAPGIQIVPTHADAPIDDGPGALAPELRVEDVVQALVQAYANWPALAEAAQENAPRVAEQWSWTAVTKGRF